MLAANEAVARFLTEKGTPFRTASIPRPIRIGCPRCSARWRPRTSPRAIS
ncbi:MAG: hypothetical protein ACLSAH_16570 [Bilophila wadsworthia]